MLLQTDMNRIERGCDSTKCAETTYFHCDFSNQNENERMREKCNQEKKHGNR